jgi:5'-methylthioadenosine phosphorylase
MSIIGMTTSPEAFLAAEAEIAYAVMAHITDYDVWHDGEGPVSVDKVVQVLQSNTALAQQAISHIVQTMDDWAGDFAAHHNLKGTLLTDRSRIPDVLKVALKPLVGKYLE